MGSFAENDSRGVAQFERFIRNRGRMGARIQQGSRWTRRGNEAAQSVRLQSVLVVAHSPTQSGANA